MVSVIPDWLSAVIAVLNLMTAISCASARWNGLMWLNLAFFGANLLFAFI